MPYFIRLLLWPLLFTAQLIAIALLSWHVLAQFHFAYPVGYTLLKLDTHIAEYAPLNRHKKDFKFTSKQEHWRLFGEISDAVQDHGTGLRDISYQLANGQSTPLMHNAEVVHLQDVANLIDHFYLLGCCCALLWLILLGIAWWQRAQLPSLKKVLGGFLLAAGAITLTILAVGATDVFYWFHVHIFPDGHQWFFYYEDSLMTTLMKAPDIFAFIAVLLLGLLLLLWGLSLWGIARLLTAHAITFTPSSSVSNKNNKPLKHKKRR